MPDDRTPFTVDDLYQLDWLEDPRCAPDGRRIAFVRVTVDRVGNCYRRAIWLAHADGRPPRRFTAGLKSDSMPRWSPDGRRLAFVSNRDGAAAQIYTIDLDGGEARRLTNMPNGASAPAWSPDGKRIAFLSPVSADERADEDRGPPPPVPDDEWEQQQAATRRAHDEARRFDPRVLSRLPYRSGATFFDDRRNHLYLIDLRNDADADAPAPRRLTDDDLHYAAPVWMPDGQSLLTTATRDPEADSIFAYYDVLRIPIPADGRGEPQRLTEAGYSYYDPEPSPDGRTIALRRLPDARPLAAGARIALLSATGGALHDVTAEADLDVERFRWMPDGHGLLFTAPWRGDQPIYRVMLEGAEMPRHGDTETPRKDESGRMKAEEEDDATSGLHLSSFILPPLAVSQSPGLVSPAFPADARIVTDFDIAPNGSIAFVAGTPANPCELFIRQPDGSTTQLTAINCKLLEQRQVVPIEELVYTAPDGRAVQGWVLYPPGYDPAREYPLAVHIHGGPHVMWGSGFRSMWHEWQTTAGRGYVVFFCNPRGSEGYGEDWRDAIHANWGVADAPDILAGIDALIARGGIDPARIGVTGGSYGGYMTAWLIGHTDRFACAVAARGVYNLLSEHSTSDAHELIEFEFDGYPWDLHDKLWQHSPLAHAHKITTPLRILHSEQDYRVPISEAEQLFAILRRRKQVVEFVRYPRESHELTRSGEPRHRADHMEQTLEWFDRYCKPTAL